MHFSSVISSALRYLQDVMLLGDAKRIQKKTPRRLQIRSHGHFMRGLFVTGCLHQTDSRKREINLTLFSARVQVYELKITWEELAKSSLVVNNPEINNANIRFYAQRRRTLTREKNRRACFSQTSQKRTITRKQKPQNEFQTCGRTLQI